MSDEKSKFLMGQKVLYIFEDGETCPVTIINISFTQVGFYYEVVGWEKTSWGYVSESKLRKQKSKELVNE